MFSEADILAMVEPLLVLALDVGPVILDCMLYYSSEFIILYF